MVVNRLRETASKIGKRAKKAAEARWAKAKKEAAPAKTEAGVQNILRKK